jgi:succinate--hydroxymethylglutarate CoA-transferase
LAGDDTRSWRPPSAEVKDGQDIPLPKGPSESAYFLSVNRNKRAMSVNFKTTKGLEIVHKLVKEADILVENYIPGMTRMMMDMDSDRGCREVK